MNILKEVYSNIAKKSRSKIIVVIFDNTTMFGGSVISSELAKKIGEYLEKTVKDNLWIEIDDLIHITGFCSETSLRSPVNYEFRVTAYLDGELFGRWMSPHST